MINIDDINKLVGKKVMFHPTCIDYAVAGHVVTATERSVLVYSKQLAEIGDGHNDAFNYNEDLEGDGSWWVRKEEVLQDTENPHDAYFVKLFIENVE